MNSKKIKSVITDITEINFRLTNDDFWLRRNIEDRDRQLSAVNPKKIEPNVNCATQTVINDGISTTSKEDLTQQSFLRLYGESDG